MVITKEFLQSEIARFERDCAQAQEFVKTSGVAIAAYMALVDRLDAPDPVAEVPAPVVTEMEYPNDAN